ncbi:MAG: S41 family peptidase [Janthinobacterium lividum]
MNLNFFSCKSLYQFWLNFIFLLFISSGCAETKVIKEAEIKPTQDMTAQDAMMFFSYVTDRVRREYVEPKSNDKLLEGAINGMLTSLDPHSAYLTPKQYQDIKKQTMTSNYGGLGIEMIMEEGVVRVISAIPDTPAAKAGIQPGDYIVMIDNQPVIGLNSIEASDRLRGLPNTTVKLTIRRQKIDLFDLEIKREDINIKPVSWRLEDKIGYIQLKTFNKETVAELHKSITEIKSKLGAKVQGYVLDLRNNSGGLFDPAIAVVDTFLNQGEIVSVRGRDAKNVTKFQATSGDMTDGMPLVILINGGTASSSEIVAGALQDQHRAIVVGTTSFGKGSIQNVIPLTNGGAMKFTTAAFYTPSGKSIQKQGIIPDVKIEQQVDLKAIREDKRLRESNLALAIDFNHTKDPTVSSKEPAAQINQLQNETVSPLKETTLEKEGSLKDFQLEQAINVIKVQNLLSSESKLSKKTVRFS